MKKTLSLLLAAALCLGLCGCIDPAADASAQAAAQPQPAAGSYKFCASYSSLGSGFYTVLNDAIKSRVEAGGDRLITLDPGGYQASQIEQIEDMLTEGIDVLFLAPVDAVAIKPALNTLAQAGVPIINVGTPVADAALVQYAVVPDAAGAGLLCAEDARARLPEGGRLIVLEQAASPLDKAAATAWDSLLTGGEWATVGRWETGGSAARATQVVSGFLTADPGGVDVIFAGSDTAAIGAIGALQAHNVRPGSVLVYGVGGSPEAKKLISAGWMTATAAQSPGEIGEVAAAVAYQVMEGALPAAETIIPSALITPENIAGFSLETWQ